MKIIVQENGPYLVTGDVPLARKTQVVTEFGEPVAWEKEGDIAAVQPYELCRCGHSSTKPFCDYTHASIGFDGAEGAPTDASAERRERHAGGGSLIVHRDYAVCCESGFCGTRLANLKKMLATAAPDDTNLRSQIIAMIERCPSGSYTYSIEGRASDIEPDLPAQIAVTTEITSSGPIAGPLWVTGAIEVERADGQPMETRQRVTLCRCGLSQIKPLCDGTHRAHHVTE